MERSTLEDLGQPLDIKKRDVRALKKQRKVESIFSALDNKFVSLLTKFSAAWGVIIMNIYAYRNSQSYPGTYDPPGGIMAPIIIFGGGVGLAGVGKAVQIKMKDPPDKKTQLFLVRATVSLMFLAFTVGYFFGYTPWILNSWTLYNCYAKEDELGKMPLPMSLLFSPNRSISMKTPQ